jgi:HPt (histidine-containing phosphotransfer) domain-containing protein
MIKPDLAYLETISGGDKSFITSVLNLFLTNTYPELADLKELADTQQWKEMGSIAHKMKAPVQMLGVQSISDLIMELEKMGKEEEDTTQAIAKVNELTKLMHELRTGIEDYLNA